MGLLVARRTLVDPCASMRINLCIVAIPAHMGLLVARRALSGPLTIMLFGPGPATIPTLVLLLATFCAMAFPSARIGILFDDAEFWVWVVEIESLNQS